MTIDEADEVANRAIGGRKFLFDRRNTQRQSSSTQALAKILRKRGNLLRRPEALAVERLKQLPSAVGGLARVLDEICEFAKGEA